MSVKPGPTAQREAAGRARKQVRLTLLRHGEPDWAPDPSGAAVQDPGLTPFGEAQAKAVAEAIARDGVDAIYVSPYRRSQQTAEPLARATGLTPITIEGLREISLNVEGLTQEQVDKVFVEGSRRPLAEHWEGWPGGERFTDFHRRVTSAIAEVLARHSIQARSEGEFTTWSKGDETPHIVIVAHGGTNAVLLTHLLDIRPVPWEWLRFESALCAYSVLQARPLGGSGRVWSLQNFNELDPQRNAGLIV